MFEKLTDAIELATFAHKYQVDKSGFPYIEHPLRVMRAVQAHGAPPFVQIAAVLHDVSEDTPFSPTVLTTLGFSEPVTLLVSKLSRKFYGVPGSKKSDDEYYGIIRDDQWAKLIKNCDMDDNTLPWRLSYFSDEKQQLFIAKYEKGRAAINA